MCDEKYESGGKLTVGGGSGNYLIRSPFNTECEWTIYAVTANGVGLAVISPSNPMLQQMTTANPTIGLSSGGSDTNVFEGTLLQLGNPFVFMPMEDWQPLGRGATINVAITLISGSCYVIVAIRRSLTRVIPQIPKKPRSTHTPLSAKRSRTFYQGWNEADESRVVGAAINVKPNEDTSTSDRHMPPGINPMAELQRRAKRGIIG